MFTVLSYRSGMLPVEVHRGLSIEGSALCWLTFFSFVLLFVSLNKQKLCWRGSSKLCILPFSWTSTEEVRNHFSNEVMLGLEEQNFITIDINEENWCTHLFYMCKTLKLSRRDLKLIMIMANVKLKSNTSIN